MGVVNPGGGGVTPPVTIAGANPNSIPLTVKGAGGQVSDVYEVQDSAGNVLLSVGPGGAITLGKNDGATNNVIRLANNAGSQGSQIQVSGDNHQVINADSGAGAYLGGVNEKTVRWDGFNSFLAFHGAAPIAKPNVTGSKGANAALTSLMTALAGYGLVTDSTT